MSSKKKAASSARVGDAHEKSTDKLSVKEFRDRFCIPNGVIVELLNGEDVVSTEKAEQDIVVFSKEQFNAGLRFPLPALFMEFLSFTKIPPVFIHPNIIRPVRAPVLPSIGDGTARLDEGGAKGQVMVRGAWAGSRHPARPFSPNYSLAIPGPEKRGHLMDWVEKASFACLSKLFEIDAKERQCKTLLTARNLMAVVRESQEYVINILPRKMPNEVVPGEHYTMKDLPIYQALKEADAEKRRALLDNREEEEKRRDPSKAPGQKRGADSPQNKAPAKKKKLVKNGKGVKEPTPPKEFAPPPIIHEAEVIIEKPVNPAPHSISSGSGHVAGLNHSSTSLAAVARLANLAEEAASINHPDSPNRMSMQLKPFVRTRWRKRGQKARVSPWTIWTVWLLFCEGATFEEAALGAQSEVRTPRATSRSSAEIEVSCSSAHDAHPEGGEVEMTTEPPTIPVMVQLRLHPGRPIRSPDVRDGGNAGEWSPCMAQQHDLFADLLRTTDYMKIFASRHKESENQLRLRLEEAEASLSTIRKDNEALRVDLAEAKSREESTADRLHEAADEMARLRGEVRHLRTEVSIEKKQREDLQLRLVAQKEELEREFAAEREELKQNTKKQVYDTFIFGYRCCMKKNGIKRDVPSFLWVKKRNFMISLLPDSFSFGNFFCNLLSVFLWSGDLFVHTLSISIK
ncbi:hypothetical protein CK203_029183 [Vitis vinifera]|uniref:Uncharacterized protein n=1 Tax=Vitis vinifera TaxID=29760 RepID=A0A438ISP3_VITVI|nr:hypothetical protein CK203_029183 [Vitis vinifera]